MSEDASLRFQFEGETWTLEYRDGNHAYFLYRQPPKKRVVSCSTIAKVEYSSNDGLLHWAVNEHKAGRKFTDSRDFAAECGSAAHAQLDALAKTGEPLDLEEQPERVRGALQATARWWLDVKPTFVASEVLVASPRYQFAGRFDFLATIDGELVLGDLKTTDGDKDWSHFRRYKAAAAFCQLAGYSIAFEETYPDRPQPTGRCILRVGADGDYDWKRDRAPEESEQAFLNKLAVYRQDQAWAKAYEKAAA